MLKIYDFSVNYAVSPTLIPIKAIRFGWKLESEERDVLQASYRIVITKESETVADTGTVLSGRLFNVGIDGLTLDSKTEYTFTLTVTDSKGNTATLSHTATTEILPHEWNAAWIKPEYHIEGWAPYLRTKFEVSGIKKAVMFACGLGCAEYYINGKKTDDFLIDPPATNYEKTVLYRKWDVTDLIHEGGNALAILLGDGFYSQCRVWGDGMKYGDVCAILRLEITLLDGSVKVVTTNTEDWKYKYSPIILNNIYGGEAYDSRLETDDFSDFNGSDKGWGNVIEDETPKGELTPCFMPPVRIVRELPALSVHCVTGKEDGAWIFDFGENIAGIGEFRLPPSPKGSVHVFRFAENLNANGQLDLRSAGAFATQCIQQDIFISNGNPDGDVYRPRFTYHGFRFVEISGIYDTSEGYGTMPKVTMTKAYQISTAMRNTAEVKTDCKDLNDLLRIMKNTFISNFHGYPEDCPAREKCGWLGDAQVCCNYGLLNFDSMTSYRKYMDDIRTSKEVYGTWQMIAPGKRTCGDATPLWGCAQIIIPYYMYKYCGDTDTVLKYFNLMEEWVNHELQRSEDYIISVGLGDWCPPGPSEARMPVEHSSTLIFYELCNIMAELCAEFGKGDKEYYTDLAEKIKESFIRHYYNRETHSYGYWGSDGVAIETGLYPDGERENMLHSLAEKIKADDFEMPTAIYANKYLVPMLMKNGYGDYAFEFLFNRRHSSFGTMMDDNATTVWEAVSMKNLADTDKSVASYNHPMQGSFIHSVITDLCGITPKEVGFSKISFAPSFIAAVKDISAEIELITGKVSLSVTEENGAKLCTLTVPAGVTATVDVKGAVTVDGKEYSHGTELGSGEHKISIL